MDAIMAGTAEASGTKKESAAQKTFYKAGGAFGQIADLDKETSGLHPCRKSLKVKRRADQSDLG